MKHVDIYTDGACKGNPGPGGYAAILIYGKKEIVLSGFEPDTTNNRMELTAALKALEALKEPCAVSLYSDSSYLVNAFNESWIYNWEAKNWKSTSKDPVKNPDLFKRLLELSRVHAITWIHVKGHADNVYNNRCDEIAVNEYRSRIKDEPDESVTVVDDVDVPYKGPLDEEIVSVTKRFSGKVFDLEERVVRLPDGELKNREIIVHNGGAAIVAVDSDRNIYLVRQYRSAAGKTMLEIPAGKLENGEDPLDAAIRELKEETGISASKKKFVKLGTFYGTPGYCSEKIHLYFVFADLRQGKPHRDRGELLRCEKIRFDDAYADALKGNFEDSKTVIGICLAASRPELAGDQN
ncbi:MAG: ribonuclease HI [Clostridia bacterium]|nr:ribonuclease HI [Clostridia bacterium]